MEHCPAYNTDKVLNPKEIALGFRAYLKENGPAAEPNLLGVHLSEEAVFQCTTCGACEHQCPVGVEHLPLIVGLRRGAVNTGSWADPRGAQLFLKLERFGNPFGLASSERDKFIQKAALPLFNGSQDYLLWLGCMGAYDSQGRAIITALASVLNHLGITFGVLKREKCSGDAARRLGNDLAFRELAEFNISQLRAVGARKLLSICPHCVRTISEDWQEILGDSAERFEIEHHSLLLARHAGRLSPAALPSRDRKGADLDCGAGSQPAASALVPTLAATPCHRCERVSRESRHGRHECRHECPRHDSPWSVRHAG